MRNKIIKPKTKGDFKKLTAKVGRKISRANVTKITIKSKQLHMPQQSQLLFNNSCGDGSRINDIMRGLNHFNESSRKVAIDDLKKFLLNNPDSEKFIAMIMPRALEVLFDEEKEARMALIELVSSVLTKFSSSCLRSIISVAITYICSGLTSLNRAIRKDSMTLLIRLAGYHSDLLLPFYEKVAEHVLALLPDPALTGALDVSVYMTASSKISANLFYMSLTLFSQMISASIPRSDTHSATYAISVDSSDIAGTDRPTAAVQNSGRRQLTSAHILRYMPPSPHSLADLSTCLRARFELAGNHGSTLSLVMSGSTDTNLPLSVATIDKLLLRLYTIWSCVIPSDSSAIPALLMPYLHVIARIAYEASVHPVYSSCPSLTRLLKETFVSFPISSQEVLLATPGSATEVSVRGSIDQLNLCLCEAVVTIHNCASDGKLSQDLLYAQHTVAVEYVNGYLEQLVSAVESGNRPLLASTDNGNLSARVKSLFRTLEQTVMGGEGVARAKEWLQISRLIGRLLIVGSQSDDLSSHLSLLGPAVSCLCRLAHRGSSACSNSSAKLDSGLAHALSLLPRLLRKWPSEPGPVTGKVLGALLDLLRRRSDEDYGSEWTGLGTSVLDIFRAGDVVAVAPRKKRAAAAYSAVVDSNTSYFSKCDGEMRRRSIDVWFRIPYGDSLSAATSTVISAVAGTDEETYLLRLVFERRQEFKINVFISLLLELLSLSIDRYLKSATLSYALDQMPTAFSRKMSTFMAYGQVNSMTVQKSALTCVDYELGHWLACDVGDTLRCLTTPGSSGIIKVSAMVIAMLESLLSGDTTAAADHSGSTITYALTLGACDVAAAVLSAWSPNMDESLLREPTLRGAVEDVGAGLLSLALECLSRCFPGSAPSAPDPSLIDTDHQAKSARLAALEALLDPAFSLVKMGLETLARVCGDGDRVLPLQLRLLRTVWEAKALAGREDLLSALSSHRLAVGSGIVVKDVLIEFLSLDCCHPLV